MFDLTDKIAVITGGASGIGRATAQLFAKQGAEVCVLDRNITNAKDATAAIIKGGGKAKAYQCDVSDQQQVHEIIHQIEKVDILINNAGISHIGKADTTSEADFDRVYNINVKGVYNCLHAVLPVMVKQQRGIILNVSSVAAVVGIADRFAYTMSKGAIQSMTFSVARDYVDEHIRCNCICPARVNTPFVEDFIAQNYTGKEKETFDKLSRSQPIGRMGTVDEIATLILYLCSDEASFITGCDYPIDGGFIKLNN
jgi:2-keto-3-deoxy-L-fuconate dehydrogenase